MDVLSLGGLICFAVGVFFGIFGMWLYKKKDFRKKLDEIINTVENLPDELKAKIKDKL